MIDRTQEDINQDARISRLELTEARIAHLEQAQRELKQQLDEISTRLERLKGWMTDAVEHLKVTVAPLAALEEEVKTIQDDLAHFGSAKDAAGWLERLKARFHGDA